MGRIVTLVFALLCGAVGAGCANWTVRSESSAATRYGDYRSYAWANPSGSTGNRFLDQRIRDAVASDLARRGIVPASDLEHADFLIDYSLASGPLVQTIVTPGAYPLVGVSGGAYVGALPAAMTYVYSENNVTLDFIDPRSNKVFWHGAAAFSTDKPIEVSTSKATKAVDKSCASIRRPSWPPRRVRPADRTICSTTKANGCGFGRFSKMKKPFQSLGGLLTTTRARTVARDFCSARSMSGARVGELAREDGGVEGHAAGDVAREQEARALADLDAGRWRRAPGASRSP